MQYWIDSHCHLHYGGLIENIDSVLKECDSENVKCMVCVSTDMDDHKKIQNFISHDSICQSIGIHPLSAIKYTLPEIQEYLERAIRYEKVVAIGETGLDDFRQPLDAMQIDSFALHLSHAAQHNVPIIMHTRCGQDSAVEEKAMELISSSTAVGVAHCFGGSFEFAEFLLQKGWYISFAGNLTYKNARSLHEVAKQIPIERILIETDAPFLSPEGFRGTENKPTRVIKVAEKLAALKGITLDEVQSHTYNNFYKLFHITPL